MYLYLLRHGQANTNVRRLVTGTPRDTLTDKGRKQAQAAARMLEGIPFDARFTSHWARASETGELVCAGSGCLVDERLGEVSGGDVADMSFDLFLEQHPSFLNPYDPSVRFPGGESPVDMYERVTAWLKETAPLFAPQAHVLAVCHLGPITCLLQYALSIPMRLFPRFQPLNASLSCLMVPPSCEPRQINLVFYGLTADMVAAGKKPAHHS